MTDEYISLGPGESITTKAGTITNQGERWIMLPADWLGNATALMNIVESAQNRRIIYTRRPPPEDTR